MFPNLVGLAQFVQNFLFGGGVDTGVATMKWRMAPSPNFNADSTQLVQNLLF